MRSVSNHITRIRGFTVVELLVAVALMAMLFLTGFTGFRSFLDSARTTRAIRSATSAFNTARYQSIRRNQPVKVCLESGRFILKIKKDDCWQAFSHFSPGDEMEVAMNASPVFQPTGFVSPLCSVRLRSEKRIYKITISIAGRIKVSRVK